MNGTGNQSEWYLRLHVQTHLESWLMEDYHYIRIQYKKDGSSVLEGQLPDLPTFYGILLLLRDTGINILSLKLERYEGS